MSNKKKTLIVIASAIILTTLGIKASDHIFFKASLSDSLTPSGPCPSDMVLVVSEDGNFCIDKYENAPSADCPFEDPQSAAETRGNLDNSSCRPISQAGRVPWRNISQDQAQIACSKAGKRLPTNKEWFGAALGTPDKDSGWGPDDCQVNNNWSSQPGPAGSAVRCVSGAGVFDMLGNVWEFVSGTTLDGVFEGRSLPDEGYVVGTDGYGLPGSTTSAVSDLNYHQDYFWINKNGIRGFMRGGYWDNETDGGLYAVYILAPPSYSGVGVGFRCAR